MVQFVCLDSVVQDVHWDVGWGELEWTGDLSAWEGGVVEEEQVREQVEKEVGD